MELLQFDEAQRGGQQCAALAYEVLGSASGVVGDRKGAGGREGEGGRDNAEFVERVMIPVSFLKEWWWWW